MAQTQSSDVPPADLIIQRLEQSHLSWWIKKIGDFGLAEGQRVSNASPFASTDEVSLWFLMAIDIENHNALNKMAGYFKQDMIVLAAFSRLHNALTHLSELLDIIARLNSTLGGENRDTGSREIKLCHLESSINETFKNFIGALRDLRYARTEDTAFILPGLINTTGTLARRFIDTMPSDWSEWSFFVREDVQYLWENHIRLQEITKKLSDTALEDALRMRQIAESLWKTIHKRDEWARAYLYG